MKKFVMILLTLVMAFALAACGATWLTGHRFSAGASADDVLAWANGLGVK